MMNYVRWPVMVAIVLVVPILRGIPSVAQPSRRTADLSAFLLDPTHATCRDSSTYSRTSRLKVKEKQVEINYRIHTSQFRLSPYFSHKARLTCRIHSNRFSLLRLKMGVADTESSSQPLIRVDVIQDGQVQETYPMRVGSVERSILDLKLQAPGIARPRDIAIEVYCQRHRYTNAFCHLDFLEAELVFDSASASPAPFVNLPNSVGSNSDKNDYLVKRKLLESESYGSKAATLQFRKNRFLPESLEDIDHSVQRLNNTTLNFGLLR